MYNYPQLKTYNNKTFEIIENLVRNAGGKINGTFIKTPAASESKDLWVEVIFPTHRFDLLVYRLLPAPNMMGDSPKGQIITIIKISASFRNQNNTIETIRHWIDYLGGNYQESFISKDANFNATKYIDIKENFETNQDELSLYDLHCLKNKFNL